MSIDKLNQKEELNLKVDITKKITLNFFRIIFID